MTVNSALAAETPAADDTRHAHSTAGFGALTIGSIGVVYGDIGTSPLYALREAAGGSANSVNPDVVIGVLSLILWALFIVVTLRYVLILLRADNRGESGTLAARRRCMPTSAISANGQSRPRGLVSCFHR